MLWEKLIEKIFRPYTFLIVLSVLLIAVSFGVVDDVNSGGCGGSSYTKLSTGEESTLLPEYGRQNLTIESQLGTNNPDENKINLKLLINLPSDCEIKYTIEYTDNPDVKIMDNQILGSASDTIAVNKNSTINWSAETTTICGALPASHYKGSAKNINLSDYDTNLYMILSKVDENGDPIIPAVALNSLLISINGNEYTFDFDGAFDGCSAITFIPESGEVKEGTSVLDDPNCAQTLEYYLLFDETAPPASAHATLSVTAYAIFNEVTNSLTSNFDINLLELVSNLGIGAGIIPYEVTVAPASGSKIQEQDLTTNEFNINFSFNSNCNDNANPACNPNVLLGDSGEEPEFLFTISEPQGNFNIKKDSIIVAPPFPYTSTCTPKNLNYPPDVETLDLNCGILSIELNNVVSQTISFIGTLTLTPPEANEIILRDDSYIYLIEAGGTTITYPAY